MNRLAFIAYQALLGLLVLAAFPWILLRRSREIAERLGGGPSSSGGAFWIHAASLGEFEAAAPILEELRSARPPPPIIVSCTNWIARARLQERLGPAVQVRLAPIDLIGAVRRSMAAGPKALLFFETEIWPAWIAAASRAGVPIAMLSARISDRSFPRYRRLRALLARPLSRITIIACRTQEDRRRWIEIGAPEHRCVVWGNTKYDLGPPPAPRPARSAGDPILFTIGSIRRGEEGVLDAMRALGSERFRFLLAPRHMRELDHWEDAAIRRGFRVRRIADSGIDAEAPEERLHSALRSAGGAGIDILLVDRLGLLRRLYRAADLSFVGGTLVPIGGHNLFEPAREGSPVLFGPSIGGVRDAAEALLATGGGFRIRDASQLVEVADSLARDPGSLSEAGRRARRAAESLAGGAQRTIAGLRALGFLEG